MKRRGIKTEFFAAQNRAIRRNLSGIASCIECVEDAELIMAEIRKRKEVTIKLVPEFNCSGVFISYHINFVGHRGRCIPHRLEE